MKKRRPKDLEEPLYEDTRIIEIDEDVEEEDNGDVYELRTCGNLPDCGKFLPLDRPGNIVRIRGEKIVVCDDCRETLDILGITDEDDTVDYSDE